MKRLIAMILAAMMLFSLTACGSKTEAPAAVVADSTNESNGNDTAGETSDEVEEVTLKFAHTKSEESYIHKAALQFKDKAAELSGGKITIEVYSNGQLGDEPECLEGMIMGNIDAGMLAPGNLASINSSFSVFDMPYLFKGNEHVDVALLDENAAPRQYLDEQAANAGVKILSWAATGARCFCNNIRPIEVPSDMQGIRMRTPTWPILMDVVQSFGGTVTPMSYSEVYMALQQGVTDGYENPVWVTAQENKWEVVKYLTVDNHNANCDTICMSLKVWNELSPKQQEILGEAAVLAMDELTETIRADEEEMLKYLEEKGMEIVREIDVEVWSSACDYIYDKFAGEYDEELVNLIKDVAP